MRKITITLLFMIDVWSAHSKIQTKDTTFRADWNPIIRYKYTSDPAAMVYKGKFYLYTIPVMMYVPVIKNIIG